MSNESRVSVIRENFFGYKEKGEYIYIHTISTLIEVEDDGRRGSALLHRLQVRVKTESSETARHLSDT